MVETLFAGAEICLRKPGGGFIVHPADRFHEFPRSHENMATATWGRFLSRRKHPVDEAGPSHIELRWVASCD